MAAGLGAEGAARWMLLWCGWAVVSAAPLWGQIAVPDGPPPGGVIDDARLLDEGQMAEVEEQVRRLREEAGIGLWVVTVSFVRASELRGWMEAKVDEWSGERPGLIFLVDRAQGIAVAELDERLEHELPYERLMMIGVGKMGAGGGLMDGGRVVGLVSGMVDELLELKGEQEREGGALSGWALLVALVVAGVVALCLVLLGRWQAHQLRLRSGFHYFPPVVIAQRLGADYGGGCIAVVAAEGGDGRRLEGEERA